MDALAYYIGELDVALAADRSKSGYLLTLEEAARNVITAYDAENTPEEGEGE